MSLSTLLSRHKMESFTVVGRKNTEENFYLTLAADNNLHPATHRGERHLQELLRCRLDPMRNPPPPAEAGSCFHRFRG